MNEYIIIIALAFLISFVVTPIAIKIAPHIGAMDVPKDDRRMHSKAMPRFGGLAIYIGTVASILIFIEPDPKLWGILAGGTLIFLMGVVDDIKGLSAKVKLSGQILCALILFQFSVRISFVTNPFGPGVWSLPWIVSLIVTIIWIVGITNTINLIDGLDGLAGGISAIAALAIMYISLIHGRTEIALIMLAMAGSSIGFLVYNFHPAKIFMGDAGSLFLGFMFAGVSVMGPVKSSTLIATIVPLFVLALPIFDTLFAILRRKVNGKPIMQADKGHLHHRIMDVGLGQRRSVLTLYALSGIMAIAAILLSKDLLLETVLLIGIDAVLIVVFMKERSD